MNYTTFLIPFFLLLVSCSGRTTKPEENQEKPLGITDIEFELMVHDFGKIKAGEIVVFTFEYTNIGQNDFQIERIKTDCGCVIGKPKKERVKPGERGTIEVEFNTAGLVGKELKQIEIHSNTKETKHLTIFAEVENELLDINL